MTADTYSVLVFFLAATGAAIPLALGHYVRPPETRLETGPLALLTLGTLLVLAFFYDPPRSASPQIDLTVWAIGGVIVGTWGFIAYAVLERLVLPVIERVGLWTKT